MQYTIKFFVNLITLIVIIAFVISGCSKFKENPVEIRNDVNFENEKIADIQLAKKLDDKLNLLAQQIAVSLNDQDVLNTLSEKMKNANTREDILYFSELLEKKVGTVTYAEKIASARKGVYTTDMFSKEQIYNLAADFSSGLDIYFPVKTHRK